MGVAIGTAMRIPTAKQFARVFESPQTGGYQLGERVGALGGSRGDGEVSTPSNRPDVGIEATRGLKPDTDVPMTTREQEVLENTASKDGDELTAEELNTELEVAGRAERKLINEEEYVEEIELPNGHKWKRRRSDGGWCRFTTAVCFESGEQVFGRPENWRSTLEKQAHGKLTHKPKLTNDHAKFIVNTYGSIQRQTESSARGTRPSALVAELRQSARDKPQDLYVEEGVIRVDAQIISISGINGSDVYHINKELMLELAKSAQMGNVVIPNVPDGRLSYPRNMLQNDHNLKTVMDYYKQGTRLSNRSSNSRISKPSKKLYDESWFEVMIKEPQSGSFLVICLSFNEGCNSAIAALVGWANGHDQ